jgi:hypothetical protein
MSPCLDNEVPAVPILRVWAGFTDLLDLVATMEAGNTASDKIAVVVVRFVQLKLEVVKPAHVLVCGFDKKPGIFWLDATRHGVNAIFINKHVISFAMS